jgi:hypothetical protein
MPAGPPRVAVPSARKKNGVVTLRVLANAGGTSTQVRFEYGTSRAYGNRSTAKRITGAVAVPVTATLRLRTGVVYHYRAVATNAKGTVRGPDRTVRT